MQRARGRIVAASWLFGRGGRHMQASPARPANGRVVEGSPVNGRTRCRVPRRRHVASECGVDVATRDRPCHCSWKTLEHVGDGWPASSSSRSAEARRERLVGRDPICYRDCASACSTPSWSATCLDSSSYSCSSSLHYSVDRTPSRERLDGHRAMEIALAPRRPGPSSTATDDQLDSGAVALTSRPSRSSSSGV